MANNGAAVLGPAGFRTPALGTAALGTAVFGDMGFALLSNSIEPSQRHDEGSVPPLGYSQELERGNRLNGPLQAGIGPKIRVAGPQHDLLTDALQAIHPDLTPGVLSSSTTSTSCRRSGRQSAAFASAWE
jgi:hypothetical protein